MSRGVGGISPVVVAVAQASSYSSDATPSLGTPICRGCGPQKQKKKIHAMAQWVTNPTVVA